MNPQAILIVACHLNDESLLMAVARQLAQKLEQQKNKVIFVDLYREKFNPVLSIDDELAHNQGMELRIVNKYQKMITASKRVIFIFPLWWGSYPALLKGFIDRVFSYDFAYRMDGDKTLGLLTHLSVDIIFTMANSSKNYQKKGLLQAMSKINREIIFNFCGCRLEQFLFIDNVRYITHTEIKKKIATLLAHYD